MKTKTDKSNRNYFVNPCVPLVVAKSQLPKLFFLDTIHFKIVYH